MNWKSEKGFTGTDIAVSVVVIFIFVSLIAILSYNFNSSAREVELKYQATEIAVNEIEKLKGRNFSEFEGYGISDANTTFIEGKEIEQGFYETVTIQDFALRKRRGNNPWNSKKTYSIY